MKKSQIKSVGRVNVDSTLFNYWLQNLEENIVWQTKIIWSYTQKWNKINRENQRDKNQLKLIEELQQKNVKVKKKYIKKKLKPYLH